MLKYDLVVRPGGQVSSIGMVYDGIEGLEVDRASGDLAIRTALGVVRDTAPRSYQDTPSGRVEVRAAFRLMGEGAVGFWVDTYSPDIALIIDPGLVYSTFIGGTGVDLGEGYDMLCVDSSSHLFITGHSTSIDFPTVAGAYNDTNNGGSDVVVLKLNMSDMTIIYSTYVGGEANDVAFAICVDDVGCAYVTGFTYSTMFPTTADAFDTTQNGHADVFVFKLNATGSALVYSTYVGGETRDFAFGMCLNSTNCPYVVGPTSSSDFPTTSGAYDRTYNGPTSVWDGDGYVFALNATGGLAFSTFIGGVSNDWCNNVALDEDGNVYITGGTESAGFPTTSGAFDTSHNGKSDCFILSLDSTCSSLKYSTFVGGAETDGAIPLCIDETGRILVAGWTGSTDFPTTNGAYDTTYNGGNGDSFVLMMNFTSSTLVFSTYLGGSGEEGALGLCIDANGSAYVLSYCRNPGFPTTPGAYDSDHNGGGDVVLTKLMPDWTGLDYSTYIGGSGDDIGNCILSNRTDFVLFAGRTESSDYPVTPGSLDTHFDGADIFLTLFEIAPFNATLPSTPQNLTAMESDRCITLSWEPPEDDGGTPITAYRIYRGDAEDNLSVHAQLGPGARGFVNNMLTNGQTYHYAVCARNAKGFGPITSIVNATPFGPPGIPIGLMATAGCGTVTLGWSAPNETGGLPILGYGVLRSTDGISFTPLKDLGNVMEYLDTGLKAGQVYFYKVRAFSAIGNGSLSQPVQTIPYGLPGVPGAFRAIAGDGRVSLYWQPPADIGGRAIVGYRLYRNASGEPPALLIALGDVVAYLDEAVMNGREYYYALSALNIVGEGPWTHVGPVRPVGLPAAPEGLTVHPADGQVTLTWNAYSDGGSPILDYMVYRGSDPQSLVLVANTGTETQFEDSGLINGEAYYYQVRARTAVGEGPATPVLMAVPMGLPDAPSDLIAKAGVGKVELQWTHPKDDGGSPIIQYEILRGEDPIVLTLLRTFGPFTSRYVDSEVVNGTTYHYALVAVSAAGRSPRSLLVYAIPFGLPGLPLGFTATQVGDKVVLRWDPPANTGGRPITSFKVYRGASPDSMALLADLGNVTSHTDPSPKPGDVLFYAIAAVNEAGEGVRSEVVRVAFAGPPDMPLSLVARLVNGTVMLSWQPPTSDGGRPIEGYLLMRGSTMFDLKLFANLTNVLSYNDSTVEKGKSYFYSLLAFNGIGQGKMSQTVEVRIDAVVEAPDHGGSMLVTVN